MLVTGTHLDMHRDHESWLNDDSMWRDDIDHCRGEVSQALEQLAEIQSALRRLSSSIESHEDALDRHASHIRDHERSLSVFEMTGEGDDMELLYVAKKHRVATADHASEQRAHEQLKRELHSVMARWNALLRKLTAQGAD